MLRSILTLTILFIGSLTNLFSQSVHGTITDVENNKIPYATVILKDLSDNFLKGTTTSEQGKYKLEYKKGSYKLEVSFIGFKTYENTVNINNNVQKDIVLQEETATLNEVVVTTERSTVTQLIDKKVINVGKDLLSSGGDATTVLNQISDVNVDPNRGISLRGNQNVNILVNGKPSPLSATELLQQMPANEIDKIEIITSPSAKYRANGLTGIINIITKKKVRKGLSVNTNENINSLGGLGIASQLSYGKEKTNFKLGASYNRNVFKNTTVR